MVDPPRAPFLLRRETEDRVDRISELPHFIKDPHKLPLRVIAKPVFVRVRRRSQFLVIGRQKAVAQFAERHEAVGAEGFDRRGVGELAGHCTL